MLSRLHVLWLAGCLPGCSFPDYALEPDPTLLLARICSDGRTSGAETGVDCGGGCAPCKEGEPCDGPSDCLTLACQDGRCRAPSCDDGVKNGSETDRDCGGQCDQRCGSGDDCGADADCESGVCRDGSCAAPSCSDGAHNGDETSEDCGGPCRACATGAGCLVDADCESERCHRRSCVDPGCTDGVTNGDETGEDCGGGRCAPCASGSGCQRSRDCLSLICDRDGRCAEARCDDGVKNGDETDIDCGGSCPGCAELGACRLGRDCDSGVCQSDACVPAAPTGVPLSTASWVGRASHNFEEDVPADAFDGDPQSIWSTGVLQEPGHFFEVDLGAVHTFWSVQVDCSLRADVAGRMDLYLWQSDEPSVPVRAGIVGFQKTTIEFATPQVARYLRLELAARKNAWWCIGELQVRR